MSIKQVYFDVLRVDWRVTGRMSLEIKVRCITALALIIFVLLGCESYGKRLEIETRLEPDGPGFIDAIGLEDSTGEERLPSYIIGINDIINVAVFQHPEHSTTAVVNFRGEIEIPELDLVVKVEGMPLEGAEEVIRGAISPYLLGPPPVRIRVRQVNSKFFYAFGAIGIPGRHRLGMVPLYLRDAVIRAGLFDEMRSAVKRICVIRPDPEKPTFVVVNAQKILMGNLKHNFALRNGDVIYVPDTLLYKYEEFIDHLVRQIQNIQTIDQAVAFIERAEDKIRNAPFEDKRGRTVIIYQ